MNTTLLENLKISGFAPYQKTVRDTVSAIDPAIINCIVQNETTLRVLGPRERFSDVHYDFSQYGHTDFDTTGGLYDSSKNMIVLRYVEPHIIVHEIFHLLDYVLGEKKGMRSAKDDDMIKSYKAHIKDGMTISAYAQKSVVEYTAETGRAVLGYSPPRPASRMDDLTRITRIDPTSVAIIRTFLNEITARYSLP